MFFVILFFFSFYLSCTQYQLFSGKWNSSLSLQISRAFLFFCPTSLYQIKLLYVQQQQQEQRQPIPFQLRHNIQLYKNDDDWIMLNSIILLDQILSLLQQNCSLKCPKKIKRKKMLDRKSFLPHQSSWLTDHIAVDDKIKHLKKK